MRDGRETAGPIEIHRLCRRCGDPVKNDQACVCDLLEESGQLPPDDDLDYEVTVTAPLRVER